MIQATPFIIKVAPLTIHTPLPVAIPTPLHVQVEGGLPDWVGYLTLAIAVVTLLAVYRQIVLAKDALKKANEQLKVANQQLKLGADEIELVKDDLAIQREQNEEFRRRPRLLVKLAVAGAGTPQARVHIANVGQRTSNNYRVRVYFPNSTNVADRNAFRKASFAEASIANTKYFILEAKWSSIAGESYLYAGESKYADFANLDVREGTTILWDADDDAGHYPKKRLGAIHIAADYNITYVALSPEIEKWIEQERSQGEDAAQADELANG